MAEGEESAEQLTLRGMQREVDEWIRTYGVRYFGELTNMACLTEEVGELARIMARRFGEQSSKPTDKACSDEALADELADIVWVVACIANQTGTDLAEAFRRNIRKKTERDSTRHIGNPKLREAAPSDCEQTTKDRT